MIIPQPPLRPEVIECEMVGVWQATEEGCHVLVHGNFHEAVRHDHARGQGDGLERFLVEIWNSLIIPVDDQDRDWRLAMGVFHAGIHLSDSEPARLGGRTLRYVARVTVRLGGPEHRPFSECWVDSTRRTRSA